MRKFICSLLLFLIGIFFSFDTAFAAVMDMTLIYDGQAHRYIAEEIDLQVDGRQIENLTMPPVIIDNYTMVPAREVFEQLGAFVDWNGPNGLVYIAYGRDLVLLQIDNNVAYLNDAPIVMDVAPKIINDKTMIPVRFAAEALGFKVGWNPVTRVVSVDSPQEDAPDVPISVPEGESGSLSGEADSTTHLDQPITDLDDIIPAKDISTVTIPAMDYPETAIVSVSMVDNGRHGVDIVASSEISRVETSLLPDNRLVVDFYRAEMQVPSTELTPSAAGSYRKIRVAQNAVQPEKITRVVLELQNAVNYAVSISPDRKVLSIDFEMNMITDINHSGDNTAGYITITGRRTPTVSISNLTGPDRLVVDIPYAQITPGDIPVNSRFINTVRSGQFENDTARVVLDLADRVKYSVSYSGNTVTIRVEEPTYKNIWYDNDARTIRLAKNNASPISAGSIGKTDRYQASQYIFTLPGNYTGIYGYGDYEINDANMRAINIETTDNITRITAFERKVFETVITEDSQYVYIEFVSPKQIYSKIVVIDPGHGGSDPGTNGFGVEEKVFTLDISMRLMELLNANYAHTGIKAYATRTDDTYISRFDRAPYANAIGDLFVSVHLNSAAPNEVPNGTETYFHPHANDNTIGISTEETANIFHKHLLNRLGLMDRKVKQNTYTVLLDTTMPSVLCEIGFLSNPEDAEKLKDAVFRQLAAEALYAAVVETFSVYTPAR